MRSLLILILAVAGFVYLAAEPHRAARAILEREDRALRELRERAARGGPAEVAHAAGYEYRWARNGVLIARPERGGVRWFATTDGQTIYEFDPSLHQAGPQGPPTAPIAHFLEHQAAEGSLSTRPLGWKRLP